MDSNHDIVPTLRMMDGVYTGLAADEIERLRARVALLERRADTSLIPGAVPTHRCKVCGAYWRKWNVNGQMSWNLNSRGSGKCCDNTLMADQIEALASPAKEHADRYRVEKSTGGFWPCAVRCGTGTRDLFVGHKKQCERVAAELRTAFEDGRFVAQAEIWPNAMEQE